MERFGTFVLISHSHRVQISVTCSLWLLHLHMQVLISIKFWHTWANIKVPRTNPIGKTPTHPDGCAFFVAFLISVVRGRFLRYLQKRSANRSFNRMRTSPSMLGLSHLHIFQNQVENKILMSCKQHEPHAIRTKSYKNDSCRTMIVANVCLLGICGKLPHTENKNEKLRLKLDEFS